MVCEKSNDLMMRYMDGLLDHFDEMNLEKHIQTCQTCREDFAMYTEILQGIGGKFEIAEAPEGFEAAVMAQIKDIKIYFPAKVRNKGKIVDAVLFAVWGLAAITAASGILMFYFNQQIFAWLDANGLHALSMLLHPFAAWTAEFGAATAAYASTAFNWLVAEVGNYWPALATAFGGLVALATLAMKMSPKYAKGHRAVK